MSPYFLFIAVLIFGAALVRNSSSPQSMRKNMLIFAWVVMTVFCGSTDGRYFGGDVSVYFSHAHRASDMTLEGYMSNNPFEPGFCIYIWAITHLFGDPQAFFFVQYGIVNAAALLFVNKYADNVLYGIIGYVCLGGFLFYFTAMRQAVAMAICLMAFMQMDDGHWIRSLLIILLATTFHVTSVVFIPALIVRWIRFTNKNIALIILACIVLSFFLRPLVEMGNEYMGEEYGRVQYQFKSYVGPLISIVSMGATLWLFIINRRYGFDDKRDNVFFYVTIIALTFYLMRFEVLAMERVAFYFIPFTGIALANCVNRFKLATCDGLISNLYLLMAPILFLVRCNNTFGASYRMFW